jgi:antitoxin component YwqK of YwqJK toxin-antitoxin module
MRFLFIAICSTMLLSCKSNSANDSSNQNIQHDTIVSIVQGQIKKEDIIKDGEYIKHYKNGVIEMRGMMKDGKRDGIWKSWYENGSPWSETTFKDGKKNGPTTTWYENEKKRYEGFYTDDNESGKWIFWNEKGNQVNAKDYSLN